MRHVHAIEIDGIELDVAFDTEYKRDQIERPNGMGVEHVTQLEIECITYDRARFTEEERHIIDSYLFCNKRINDTIHELLTNDYHDQEETV